MFKYFRRLIGDRAEIAERVRGAHFASEELTLDEAEERALHLLADPARYAVEPGGTEPPDGSPPGLQRLFSRYRTVRSLVDELEIGLDLISPSDVRTGCTSVLIPNHGSSG